MFSLPPYRYILMMKAECLLRTGKSGRSGTNCNRNQTTRIQVCSGKAVVNGAELMGGSTYDYGLRETNLFGQRLKVLEQLMKVEQI